MSSNPYNSFIRNELQDSIPVNQVAVIVPKYNTTKPDATGAFQPEAENFCDRWKIPYNRIHKINNKLSKSVHRNNNVADALLDTMDEIQSESEDPIAVWVFFCHGYTHGIQFSIRSPNNPHFDSEYEKRYKKFISIIGDHPAPSVLLYACSTGDDPDGDPDTAPGSGDGSFGDCVRDDLCKSGSVYCRVFTHTTAGHTTHNPMIKILDGDGSAIGAVGGSLLATPGSSQFYKLKNLMKTKFRFELPFLTIKSIQNKL